MSLPNSDFAWRSQSAFVIVAAGATLSLSDFLIFPTLASQNGGGAFLLLYIVFLIALGLPLLMAELMLGRISRSDPVRCIDKLSSRYNASVYWKLAGLAMLVAAFLIVCSISVVAGWSIAYLVKTVFGVFDSVTVENSVEIFNDFVIDSERAMFWHTLFVILFVTIGAQSTRSVFEKSIQILVSIIVFVVIFGLGLALYSTNFESSIRLLLYADLTSINASTPLLALQRAFYTLALGLGMMMAIARYLPNEISIGYSASLIITIDLLLSILVALLINSYFLSTGAQPRLDYQFIFQYLPSIYGVVDYAILLGMIFFLMIVLGALTTAIVLVEGPAAYLQRKFAISRLKSIIILGFAIWLIGIGVVFSYGVWNNKGFSLALFFDGDAIRLVNNAGFHDVLIFISSHLIQPLVAFLICIYAGWVVPRHASFRALRLSNRFWFDIWSFMLRYVTPVLLLCVVLEALGVI